MPLQIKPATGSGSITLQATTGTTTNDTLTLPAKTGNIITSADSGTVTQAMIQNGSSGTPLPGIGATGPAFGVYGSANQTGIASGVFTKVVFNTEEFDTNNNFDSTTNYRFTPTVAGYYQINFCLYVTSATGNSMTQLQPRIYRNGSNYKAGNYISLPSGVSELICQANATIQMNGSTDYLEFYMYAAASGGSSITINASAAFTYVNGALVRAA